MPYSQHLLETCGEKHGKIYAVINIDELPESKIHSPLVAQVCKGALVKMICFSMDGISKPLTPLMDTVAL